MSRQDAPRESAVQAGARSPHGDAPTNEVPRLDTAQLFRGCNEIVIEHRGERYRLRLTRQGKLILTK